MNKKWALFFSGRGSNLEAILTRYSQTWRSSPIVVTNNPEAEGIGVARRFAIEPFILNSPIDYIQLSETLKNEGVELIFLLGFLKIIPSAFIKSWENRMFNLHPSLLPLYPGLRSIDRAYSEGSDIGVSIHRVSEGVDEGQVLVQEVVISNNSYKSNRLRSGQEINKYNGLSLEEIKLMVHIKEHQLVCDFIPWGEQNLDAKI